MSAPNNGTRELNANGSGAAGTVTTFVTLTPDHDRLRLNPSPTRTITVNVVGPATVRHATIANNGTLGSWADVAAGSSFTAASADGAREAVLMSGHAHSVLRCVTAAA
jgi:hypothetical protein